MNKIITENTKELLKIVVLILPIIVLAGMTINATNQLHKGKAWQIKIEGYDPRDLLYGHYLTFTYDWNIENNKTPPSMKIKESCLCLNTSDTGHINPTATPVSCRNPENTGKSCQSVIKVIKHGRNYSMNRTGRNDRYFIPEMYAGDLDAALRTDEHEFRVELIAHEDHSTSVGDLYIDNIKLKDFLEKIRLERRNK